MDAESDGTRGIQLPTGGSSTVTFTIPLSASGSGTGYKLSNASIGFRLSVTPTTRIAALTADLDPTYRRDANGIPVLNTPDAAGCMYGDTVVPLTQFADNPNDWWGNFRFDISRQLLGYWPHTGDSELFNQWWLDYPQVYISDGAASENTDLPVIYEFSDFPAGGPFLPASTLRGGPYTDKIRYRVTDQVDGFMTETNYYMRLHAPCELTGATWQSPYTGDLWLCPEPIGDFAPILLGSWRNDTNTPLNATLTIDSSKTYVFSSGNAEHGGIEINGDGIKFQLGIDDKEDTQKQYAVGTTIATSTTVPPHQKVYFYLHALGHVRFPIGSKYIQNGFTGDGNIWKAYYDGWQIDAEPEQ
ncbi:MAG TPA: hypothetical protein VHE55_11850 [Fimbriimonadaceae bacterium]|nr:hypothetical protein [Fimbriimonadaceae bacterium]